MRRYACNNMGITIPIYESPYFEYYADILSGLHDVKEAVRIAEEGVALHGDEQGLLAHRDDAMKRMVSSVSEHPGFRAWKSRRIGEPIHRRKTTSKNAINMNNVGRTFWKIDLVQADYHSIAISHPQIFNNSPSYGAWVSTFSETPYVVRSKRIRNMVFGQLDPGHQQFIERNVTETILDVCVETGAVAESDIVHVMHDEALLSVEPPADLQERLAAVGAGYPFRVQKIDVRRVDGTKFLYTVTDGRMKPFAVPSAYIPQIWKIINGLPIAEMDLYFPYDGRIAMFAQPIVGEISMAGEPEKDEIVFPGVRTETFIPMMDRLSEDDKAELRVRLKELGERFHDGKTT